MRQRLRRITSEIGTLATSLPLAHGTGILLAVDEERLDVLRAVLLPAPDTPYAWGAFVFDILLPADYPNRQGSGFWHMQPNLGETPASWDSFRAADTAKICQLSEILNPCSPTARRW